MTQQEQEAAAWVAAIWRLADNGMEGLIEYVGGPRVVRVNVAKQDQLARALADAVDVRVLSSRA
eukprot:COSAG02_NODE_64643_length_260_cov_0.627329_1_plen_63_part_10